LITWTRDRASGLYLRQTSVALSAGQGFISVALPAPLVGTHYLVKRAGLFGQSNSSFSNSYVGIFLVQGTPPATLATPGNIAAFALFISTYLRVDDVTQSSATGVYGSTAMISAIADDVIVPGGYTLFGALAAYNGVNIIGNLWLNTLYNIEEDC
jgi:hypothetical protein